MSPQHVLFTDIAIKQVEAFFKCGQQLHVLKGQCIIRGEDEPQGLYYIDRGLVRAYGINQRGEDYTFAILAPKELFPLNWLLHETRRQIFFQAITPCHVCVVPRERVLTEAQVDPNFCYGLMHKAVEAFSLFVDRLDNLEYKYAGERLAYRLLFLAKRFGEKRTDGSYLIKAQVSQQLLASSINASRESVNREFEQLQRKGLVRFEGPYIVIANLAGMQNLFPAPLSPNWWGLAS